MKSHEPKSEFYYNFAKNMVWVSLNCAQVLQVSRASYDCVKHKLSSNSCDLALNAAKKSLKRSLISAFCVAGATWSINNYDQQERQDRPFARW